MTIFGQLTSHRTRAVLSPTTFKIWPRVPAGINKPSIPGTRTACRASTIWATSSGCESLLISNKDDIPTDLSRKLYLLKICIHKKGYQQMAVLFQCMRWHKNMNYLLTHILQAKFLHKGMTRVVQVLLSWKGTHSLGCKEDTESDHQ